MGVVVGVVGVGIFVMGVVGVVMGFFVVEGVMLVVMVGGLVGCCVGVVWFCVVGGEVFGNVGVEFKLCVIKKMFVVVIVR